MKRLALATLVPFLLTTGAVSAAEIYNKNSNKVDFYGKMVGERVWSNTDDSNSENEDTSYARFGVKGETQINSALTGFGQFEYNLKASKPEGSQESSTRLAFAGLRFDGKSSLDYGRNYGVAYDAPSYTDMLVEWGGDSLVATDNFMNGRTNGVATYRVSDFYGEVDGFDFAVQYQGKNSNRVVEKQNGDGYSLSASSNFDGFGFATSYGKSDRTHEQSADRKGDNAEIWTIAAKYDANSVYAAVMYGETRNMTVENDGQFANKTQNVEAVVQYQFDFGLRPSLGYVFSKGTDLSRRGNFNGGDASRVNYVELGTWYYFNKNMNVYAAYKFNLLDDTAYVKETGLDKGDQFALGIVYQF
ncbi:porin [Phytobacter sp. V91]|uniref:porin n=1 Tax=Phytobacter sp. V91 TaxID=3369425 RepID=UPI003F6115A6